MQNNFNELAASYQQTATKPDKQYSILPTVLRLTDNLNGKVVLDLGCGDGFFTRPLSQQGASRVIGIDNSAGQIKLADSKTQAKNIEYRQADFFKDDLPTADVICAPFIVNYAQGVSELWKFFKRLHNCLTPSGLLIAVVDLPTGQDLRRFGSHKALIEGEKDGGAIQIDLYNGDLCICTLWATYFKKETITRGLERVGFKKINWYPPTILQEGIEKYGQDFWKGYKDNPELGYVTAVK